jgi:chromosome segregation ATPase
VALARSEIARLRADNDKLRRNAQRLLGQQLDQHDSGELLARVDSLVAENRGLNDKLLQSTQDTVGLQKQITELEEDIAAARTALRRMIKDQSKRVVTIIPTQAGYSPLGGPIRTLTLLDANESTWAFVFVGRAG